jgi:hypothetical protein
MTSDDKIIRIENQIKKLKKQKEKLQVQTGLSFYKDIQKIFGEDFRPSFVVGLLEQVQTLSSQIQKHK